MKVQATAFGFYKQKRKPGDVFEFEGIPSGNWMVPLDAAAIKAWKAAGIPVPPRQKPEPSKDPVDEGKGEPEGDGAKSTGDKHVI